MPPPMRASTRKRCGCPNLLSNPPNLQRRIVAGELPLPANHRPHSIGPLTLVPPPPRTHLPIARVHCLVPSRPCKRGQNRCHPPSRRPPLVSTPPPGRKERAVARHSLPRARPFRLAENLHFPLHGPLTRVTLCVIRQIPVILEARCRSRTFPIAQRPLWHKMARQILNAQNRLWRRSLNPQTAFRPPSLPRGRQMDFHRLSLDNASPMDSRRHSLQINPSRMSRTAPCLSHSRKRILPGNAIGGER
jgi:hypothetical protein